MHSPTRIDVCSACSASLDKPAVTLPTIPNTSTTPPIVMSAVDDLLAVRRGGAT
jgi:hypothetical protein